MKIKFYFESGLFDEDIKKLTVSNGIQNVEFSDFNTWSSLVGKSDSNDVIIFIPTVFLKEDFIKNSNIKAMTASEVQSADLAIYVSHKKQKSIYFFWKDCLQQIVQKSLKLSSGKSIAYVTYSEVMLKPLVNVMFKLGVSKFKVISCDKNVNLDLFSEIKRTNFQIEIDLLPIEQMVNLSGDGVLLLNTWSDKDNDESLQSLAFFNFLDINSVIMSFSDVSPDHSFIKDAKEEGIKLVDFFELKFLQLELILKFVAEKFKT